MTQNTENPKYECLRDLLMAACPLDEFERRTIKLLSTHLGVSHQTIFYWLKTDRVPAGRVKDVVAISAGRVTLEDLLPYVL